jgi:tetratricopeptide (TPR) repeat protein
MKKTIYIILIFMTACSSKDERDKSLTLALRSDTLIEENRLDEAEIIINEAIKLDKENHIAYNNLGILRIRQNLSSELVLEPLIKSLSINPYYEMAAYNLANYYHEIKDYPNAIIFCTKYLVLIRNSKEATGNISHIYAIRSESKNIGKQFHEAILDSDSALSYNPNSFGAYKERGSAYRELRQFDEAIRNYSKAIDINPDYAQAYNGLAICLDNGKKDFNGALQYYTKAIDLDSQSATYIYNRGACLFDNGFKDKALPDLIKADKLGKQEAKSYLEKYLY